MTDYQFTIINRKCYIYLSSVYLGRVWVENDGEVKADAERDVMWLPVMEALEAMSESEKGKQWITLPTFSPAF